MRIALVVLLVLLNAGIFVYFQFGQTATQHQPLPEVRPEALQVLSEQEIQALPAAADEAVVTE